MGMAIRQKDPIQSGTRYMQRKPGGVESMVKSGEDSETARAYID